MATKSKRKIFVKKEVQHNLPILSLFKLSTYLNKTLFRQLEDNINIRNYLHTPCSSYLDSLSLQVSSLLLVCCWCNIWHMVHFGHQTIYGNTVVMGFIFYSSHPCTIPISSTTVAIISSTVLRI